MRPSFKKKHWFSAAAALFVSLIATGCSLNQNDWQPVELAAQLGAARIWLPQTHWPMDGSGRKLLGDGWIPWRQADDPVWFPLAEGPGIIKIMMDRPKDLQMTLTWDPRMGPPQRMFFNDQPVILLPPLSSEAENSVRVITPASQVIAGENRFRIHGGGKGVAIRSLTVQQGVVDRGQPSSGTSPLSIGATAPFALEFDLVVPAVAWLSMRSAHVSAASGAEAAVKLQLEAEDGAGNVQPLVSLDLESEKKSSAPVVLSLEHYAGKRIILRISGWSEQETPAYVILEDPMLIPAESARKQL